MKTATFYEVLFFFERIYFWRRLNFEWFMLEIYRKYNFEVID